MEQQKEKKDNARKNPWGFVFVALAVLGAADLLGRLWSWLAVWWMTGTLGKAEAASIGIIGGADGPTSILVATSDRIVPVLLLAVGIGGLLRRRHQQR